MLPSLSLLEKIHRKIKNLPNQQGEYKRKEHYCCYLLCEKAGLRVSEAISFDLANKTRKDLYLLNKTKGKKERFVYIPQGVINELKKHDWQPNHTNRFNFYHFLRKIKKALGVPQNIELTPHTLRRVFATYHAENGLPLPLLSKLLGHQSVRTTALYWMNIYNDGGNDTDDILTGKVWLEKPKKPQLEPEAPVNLNLDELPELLSPNSLASESPSNYLNKIQHLENQLSQIQSKKDQKIEKLTAEKEALQNDLADSNEQNATLQHEKNQIITEKQQIQQELIQARETIKQLVQELTNEQGKRTIAENNLSQERKISAEQKQTINDLNQQLQAERKINNNLTQKLSQQDKTIVNLQNAYQKASNDKQATELFAGKEKQKADNYEQQLKTIVKTLYRWKKISYYQQLEQEQKCHTVQAERPPPWKVKN